MQIEKYTIRDIQFGKYKSQIKKKNGKAQIGRTVGTIQIGAIYDIATELIRVQGGGGMRRIHVYTSQCRWPVLHLLYIFIYIYIILCYIYIYIYIIISICLQEYIHEKSRPAKSEVASFLF